MTRFSSLNLDELKALASEWGRNCPVIKKITLYHGYKEPYVLVAEIPELPKTTKKEKKTDEELEQEQELNKWFDPLGAELLEDIATSKVAPDVNWEEWFFFVVETEKEIPLKHFVHIESAETIYPITSKTPNNKSKKELTNSPAHRMMNLPEAKYYSLQEVAGLWHCTVNRLYQYAEEGKLEICIYVEESPCYIGAELERKKVGENENPGAKVKFEKGIQVTCTHDGRIDCTNRIVEAQVPPAICPNLECERLKIIDEPFEGGPCPVILAPKEWRKLQEHSLHTGNDDPLSYVLLKHPTKEGYLYPDRYTYDASRLIITHEEKKRFERTYIKKTPNNTGLKYDKLEHELWEVIANVYNDLQENEGIPKPSNSQVRKRIKQTFKNMDQSPEETDDPLQKKYDPDGIIQEVTRSEIHWWPSKGKEKTYKLNTIKDTLTKLKKRKRITPKKALSNPPSLN